MDTKKNNNELEFLDIDISLNFICDYIIKNNSNTLIHLPLTEYVIINPMNIKSKTLGKYTTCIAINNISKKIITLDDDKNIHIENAYDYVIRKTLIFKEDLSKLKYVEQLNLFKDVERSNE